MCQFYMQIVRPHTYLIITVLPFECLQYLAMAEMPSLIRSRCLQFRNLSNVNYSVDCRFRHRAGSVPARPVFSGRRGRTQSEGDPEAILSSEGNSSKTNQS